MKRFSVLFVPFVFFLGIPFSTVFAKTSGKKKETTNIKKALKNAKQDVVVYFYCGKITDNQVWQETPESSDGGSLSKETEAQVLKRIRKNAIENGYGVGTTSFKIYNASFCMDEMSEYSHVIVFAPDGVKVKIKTQAFSSLGLAAEGPHFELTDWKNGKSKKEVLTPGTIGPGVSWFMLEFAEVGPFPNYTKKELKEYLKGQKPWVQSMGSACFSKDKQVMGICEPIKSHGNVEVILEQKGKPPEQKTFPYHFVTGC